MQFAKMKEITEYVRFGDAVVAAPLHVSSWRYVRGIIDHCDSVLSDRPRNLERIAMTKRLNRACRLAENQISKLQTLNATENDNRHTASIGRAHDVITYALTVAERHKVTI